MKRTKIIFYLKKDKKNADGKSAIYGKITVASTKATFATRKFISVEDWKNSNHLRNVVKKEENIKIYLKSLENRFDSLLDKLRLDNNNVYDAHYLKALLFSDNPQSKNSEKTVLEVIDFHNNFFRKLVEKGTKSTGTLEKYERVKNILSEFLQKKYSSPDLGVSQLNSALVFQFDSYLRTEKSYRANVGCCNNTTVKYMRSLKTMFNYAVKRGFGLKENPFLVYDEKIEPVNTIFLEESELRAIENKVFSSDRLNTVKNIFLFSCFTGYAPCDAMNLQWSNVQDLQNDGLWIITKRKKTKTNADVPILPITMRIIEEFKNDPRCVNGNKLLPKISNQKMNEYLKEIAEICNINKNLKWYVARHTFATTVTGENDIPLGVISEMLGHTNLSQTQHYSKTQKSQIKNHMNKLRSKFS